MVTVTEIMDLVTDMVMDTDTEVTDMGMLLLQAHLHLVLLVHHLALLQEVVEVHHQVLLALQEVEVEVLLLHHLVLLQEDLELGLIQKMLVLFLMELLTKQLLMVKLSSQKLTVQKLPSET